MTKEELKDIHDKLDEIKLILKENEKLKIEVEKNKVENNSTEDFQKLLINYECLEKENKSLREIKINGPELDNETIVLENHVKY